MKLFRKTLFVVLAFFSSLFSACSLAESKGPYTITFDAGIGVGEIEPLVVQKGETVYIPDEKPFSSLQQGRFVAWNSIHEERFYHRGDPITPTRNMTLHANYGNLYQCTCDGIGHFFSNSTEKCSECHGKGKLDHQIDVTCDRCNGEGIVKSGMECPYCKGLGHLDIWGCVYGHYIYANEMSTIYNWCPTCMNAGKSVMVVVVGHYDCPDCDDGYIHFSTNTCTKCSGSGKVKEYAPCLACHADGYKDIVTTCKTCNGLGYNFLPAYTRFDSKFYKEGNYYYREVLGDTTGYEFKIVFVPQSLYRSGNFDWMDYLFKGKYTTNNKIRSDEFWKRDYTAMLFARYQRSGNTPPSVPYPIESSVYNW